MASRYDIQQNGSGQLIIKDSDVVWGLSDQQHVQDTINAAPGWWKENPADGVNIRAYLNSDGQEQALARKVIVQLQADRYKVNNPVIRFIAGKLTIQPNATI